MGLVFNLVLRIVVVLFVVCTLVGLVWWLIAFAQLFSFVVYLFLLSLWFGFVFCYGRLFWVSGLRFLLVFYSVCYW